MSSLRPLDLPTLRGLEVGLTARMAPAVELPEVFSPAECARIIALRESLGFDLAPIPTRSTVDGPLRSHVVDRAVRRTERTHILSTPDHSWIYERLGAAVELANGQAWQFKLSYLEPLQLLAYPEDGWFDWHSDLGDRGVASLRKVSASILLSDPDTYEGGELQLMNAGKELVPGRSQGRAILFPSFQNHRVLPVRRGTRHVLILWTVGRHPLR